MLSHYVLLVEKNHEQIGKLESVQKDSYAIETKQELSLYCESTRAGYLIAYDWVSERFVLALMKEYPV